MVPTPKNSDRAPAKDPQEQRVTRSRWRSAIGAVGIVCVAFGGWLGGAWGTFPLEKVRAALARYDHDRAEYWLQIAGWAGADRGEREFLSARIARRRGELKQMDAALRAAERFGVDHVRAEREQMLAAAQTGQLDPVESAIQKWLTDPGTETAEICAAYANGLTMQGRIADAQLILKGWDKDDPTDPESAYRLGRIQEHLLAQDQAEQEYRRALERDPHYPAVTFALGRLLLDRKRPEEALPLFHSCREHLPAAALAASVGEAMCLKSLGQVAEARQILERAVQVDETTRLDSYAAVREMPEINLAAFELGKLESAEGNFAAAEPWLRQTVEADPRNMDARYAWAVALRGLRRTDDAQREFEHVTKVREALHESDRLYDRLSDKPDDVEARYKIGLAYLEYRSEKAGVYWLQSVLQFDPHHAPTHRALAEYYERHAAEQPAYSALAAHHRAQLPPNEQRLP